MIFQSLRLTCLAQIELDESCLPYVILLLFYCLLYIISIAISVMCQSLDLPMSVLLKASFLLALK